jgi:hypothetical protein
MTLEHAAGCSKKALFSLAQTPARQDVPFPAAAASDEAYHFHPPIAEPAKTGSFHAAAR